MKLICLILLGIFSSPFLPTSATAQNVEGKNDTVAGNSGRDGEEDKEQKMNLCQNIYNKMGTLKLIQTSAKGEGACTSMTSFKERAECNDMAQLMQTMAQSGDMIPIIEKLRKMRRDVERIEKEFDEERRRKTVYDKTKTQLIATIQSLSDKVVQCTSKCKNWCNEMILVLLTKLKVTQQRLIKVRVDLEKCREKIALLIIEIQHLKAIIQKMAQAILWMYSKLSMLLEVIVRISTSFVNVHNVICGWNNSEGWLQLVKKLYDNMNNWCNADWMAINQLISINYKIDIATEARQFEWTSFDQSLGSMGEFVVGG